MIEFLLQGPPGPKGMKGQIGSNGTIVKSIISCFCNNIFAG